MEEQRDRPVLRTLRTDELELPRTHGPVGLEDLLARGRWSSQGLAAYTYIDDFHLITATDAAQPGSSNDLPGAGPRVLPVAIDPRRQRSVAAREAPSEEAEDAD